ncbi:MAG: dephospho-CoA kinase [Kyrpidia tusciae]|nr:dephospho-CoA kinase [Kyrpidia tusciae]MBE3551758.1 dephospho-CoA kinase [Kyrpidia tusciae]
MIAGLTGGIASGKSTVSRMFVALGARLVDADQVAREVVEPGTDGLEELTAAFGKDILLADGQLDRKKLGARVFGRPDQLAKLNAIVHPRVRARMAELTGEILEGDPRAVVLWDVPLLIEGGLVEQVDVCILVWVPEKVQLRRLMSRNGLSAEEAMARIRSQMPLDDKRRYADYVIDNSGDLAWTRQQVERVWQALCDRRTGA